jgi:hypothetical protein
MARCLRYSLLVVLALTLLAGCGGGGGVRQRLFPPTVSVQELAQQSGGGWTLKLRLQNFSNVTMRFDALDAKLTIDDVAAGAIVASPMLAVGPESADVVDLEFTPSSAASARVRDALAGKRSIAYTLAGQVRSTEPAKRRDDFTFTSQLTAVPGLAGVLR